MVKHKVKLPSSTGKSSAADGQLNDSCLTIRYPYLPLFHSFKTFRLGYYFMLIRDKYGHNIDIIKLDCFSKI